MKRHLRPLSNCLVIVAILAAGAASAQDTVESNSEFNGLTAIVGFRQSASFGVTGQTVGVQLKYTLNL